MGVADPAYILSSYIQRINALLQVQIPMLTTAYHHMMHYCFMHSMAYRLPVQLLNPTFPFT